MNRAPIFARFVAMLIDLSILFVFFITAFVVALWGYSLGSGRLTFVDVFCILFSSSVLSCLVSLFYFTCLTAGEGMTVGKAVMNIRVVTRRNEGVDLSRNPGFLRSLVRSAAYALSAMPCYGGFLMAFFFKGRSLHDMIAGTEVVRCGDDDFRASEILPEEEMSLL